MRDLQQKTDYITGPLDIQCPSTAQTTTVLVQASLEGRVEISDNSARLLCIAIIKYRRIVTNP